MCSGVNNKIHYGKNQVQKSLMYIIVIFIEFSANNKIRYLLAFKPAAYASFKDQSATS